MSEELKNFITDLVVLLHEKYNDTLGSKDNETEKDKSFRLGLNFAYYDVLDLIESQLKAFGYEESFINSITPILGEEKK
jgi:hypothetical protein